MTNPTNGPQHTAQRVAVSSIHIHREVNGDGAKKIRFDTKLVRSFRDEPDSIWATQPNGSTLFCARGNAYSQRTVGDIQNPAVFANDRFDLAILDFPAAYPSRYRPERHSHSSSANRQK